MHVTVVTSSVFLVYRYRCVSGKIFANFRSVVFTGITDRQTDRRTKKQTNAG